MLNKIICYFKGHKRGRTTHALIFKYVEWSIQCKRCNYMISYFSPRARLIGEEMSYGFEGK